jgi:hypothetical protein
MTGALRIADWMADAAHPDEPAHAYTAMGPIPFRGMCGNGHWTVKSARVEAGPLCQVCREIVQGCATRTLDEIVDLEGAAALGAMDRLTGIEQYQAESR